jgi:lantibiotic biosynthesis protein
MTPSPDIDSTTLTADEAGSQCLARGTAGIALLHIEQAWNGSGTWTTARHHIRQATAGPIDAADHAGLYYGAPAIAFMLHTAADKHPRYRAACDALNEYVIRLARRRLTIAEDRIRRGEPATFAEFDLFYGLTGIGALLLHYSTENDVLAGILRYVVNLTKPQRYNGIEVPGWWVSHNPDEILPTPGGHANFGTAHGAAGLLALLGLATTRGHVVDGQHEAITVLTTWFDQWQQYGTDGPWWPQWITHNELRAGKPTQTRPGRPSWCYGTPGIARAQQLAAIATHNPQRQQAAEDALAASLTDTHLDKITDPGLCHGIAGIYQTGYRAARDARTPAIDRRLPELAARLAQQTDQQHQRGLLTGAAGVALALETTQHTSPPHTGWDACLLIT